MELLELFDYKMIMVVAVVTTLLVAAVNVATPKWVAPSWLLPVVALGVTLLRIQVTAEMTFSDYQAMFLNALLTWAFALLFYALLGKRFVEKLFGTIWNWIDKKLSALSGDGGQGGPPTVVP